MFPSHLKIATLATSIALGLSACGGGATNNEVPAPTTNGNPTNNGGIASATGSTSVGSITGFGSIIVDGVKLDDSQAKVTLDEKGSDIASTTASLKIGMQVEVKGDGTSASSVAIASQFRGPVSAVSANSITVLGQTIAVETSGAEAVALEGFSAFSDVKVGDWIEVFAVEATAGTWKATRIERESNVGNASTRLGGKISNIDTTAKTFKIGAITVNFADAVVTPTVAVLTNDQRVRIYSDAPAVNGVITAKKIRVRDFTLNGTKDGNLGGIVSDFTASNSFTVNGFKVDASNATYKNGSATDLINGAAIRVKGTVTNGILVAKEIEFKKKPNAEAAEIKVKGFITDFVSQSNFKLRGQQVDATGASFEGGSVTGLTNGAFVELKLSLVNGALVASKVSFLEVPNGTFDKSFQFVGVIADYDATARTFKIAGNTVKIVSDAINAQLAGLGFANGKTFAIEVKLNGTTVELVKVSLPREAAMPAIVLKGVVSEVTTTNFKLNGVTVSIANDTQYEDGTAAALVNGARVSVKLKTPTAADPFVAAKIEFEPKESATPLVRIESLITDFVSASDMRVGGVKVDASAATFVKGTVADLANSKRVKVEGVVNEAGVVNASKVEFR
jgi:carbon monoxide dehydrogenase subunit G